MSTFFSKSSLSEKYLPLFCCAVVVINPLQYSFAQSLPNFPNRSVRFVVPFAVGGALDIAARLFATKLVDSLGQQVVVDNRPGAGGIMGAEIAAKSAPDGHTLMMASISHTVLPSIHKNLSYDIVKDFVPTSLLVTFPFLLLTHPTLPVKSLKELITLAKTKPGQINYVSSGNGSTAHLNAELFKNLTGINVVHLPYKGTGPALIGFLAGEASLGFYSVSATLNHIKAGRLRALATTGAKRSASLPDLPTAIEAGVPDFVTGSWAGMLTPTGTPKLVSQRLHRDLMGILLLADVKDRLAKIDFEIVGSTSEEFSALIKSEVTRWSNVVKASGANFN